MAKCLKTGSGNLWGDRKFPVEEKFGLVGQIRRAAVSVCANLEEESTRKSWKEQMHFSAIAYGSLIEFLNHLILFQDLWFIENHEPEKLRDMIQLLSVGIKNLRNAQAAKSSQP